VASYTYPEMPLRANIWYRTPVAPPTAPPDLEDIPCSCAPITPSQHAVVLAPSEITRAWTHIIRTAVDPKYVDSYMRGDERDSFPMTMLEIPGGSGHFYGVTWAHIVGAGFPNEHARLYAWRWTAGLIADLPWFEGFI
jgi:hypothetical protein